VDTVTAARWVAQLEQAWRMRDPDGIAALFTPDARYYRGPFDPPHVGTAAISKHWTATLSRQVDPLIWFGPPSEHDGEAVVEWWCVLHDPVTYAPRTAAGCLRLRLADDGRCTEFREYWQAIYDQAAEPPAGWLS
jgi:hypothetical protein